MTMIIRLLATACFVCAQVKVEHPVLDEICRLYIFLASFMKENAILQLKYTLP